MRAAPPVRPNLPFKPLAGAILGRKHIRKLDDGNPFAV